FARAGEERAAGIGERSRGAADAQNLRQLNAVEQVDAAGALTTEAFADGISGVRFAAPRVTQSSNFVFDNRRRNASAWRERRHARDRPAQVAEIALPRGLGGGGELQECVASLAAESHVRAGASRILFKLIVEVRLDVLGSVAQRRQAEGP